MRGMIMKKFAGALLLVFFLAACIGGRQPAPMVEQYTLEYSTPRVEGLSRVDEMIKVERFSVARNFNSPAMVYRPEPFKLDVYNYHRWRVNPGDMVTDYLLRDLRNAGLFQGVLSYADAGDARFLLQGSVEEFLEVDDEDGWKATLSLNVILFDMAQREVTKRVVFQKSYRAAEPFEDQTPEGLALGMSRAMASASGRLIKDIYNAVRN